MLELDILIVLFIILREILEAFLLHLRLWLDVLRLEVEVEELESLLFWIVNILFFLLCELARLVYLVTFFVAFKLFVAVVEAILGIILSMQGHHVREDPWRIFDLPQEVEYEVEVQVEADVEVEAEFEFWAGLELEVGDAENASRRPPPLPAHILQTLPLSTMAETSEICSICHETYRAGDDARVLPCGHYFHSACVDHWLVSEHGDCPLCKRAIV